MRTAAKQAFPPDNPSTTRGASQCLLIVQRNGPKPEAAELSKTIDSFVRVAEAADLAERIKRLEQVADNS
jgi:hypothetical protein